MSSIFCFEKYILNDDYEYTFSFKLKQYMKIFFEQIHERIKVQLNNCLIQPHTKKMQLVFTNDSCFGGKYEKNYFYIIITCEGKTLDAFSFMCNKSKCKLEIIRPYKPIKVKYNINDYKFNLLDSILSMIYIPSRIKTAAYSKIDSKYKLDYVLFNPMLDGDNYNRQYKNTSYIDAAILMKNKFKALKN